MGCNSEEILVATQEFHDQKSGASDLSPVSAIVVSNPSGAVSIRGDIDTSTIRWSLDRSVMAESQERAEWLLAGIAVSILTINDTAYVTVSSIPDVNTVSSLSLTVPNSIHCIVREATRGVEASYLQTTFTSAADGATTVRGHKGNCIIAILEGTAQVEMALPDNGTCTIAVGNGDIKLRIPTSTSSVVSATTGQGVISSSGVVIRNPRKTPLTLTGSIGSGNGAIQLATGHGNISIVGF